MCSLQLEHLSRLSRRSSEPFATPARRRGAREIMLEARARMEKHPR